MYVFDLAGLVRFLVTESVRKPVQLMKSQTTAPTTHPILLSSILSQPDYAVNINTNVLSDAAVSAAGSDTR